jgi:hypothetical protein
VGIDKNDSQIFSYAINTFKLNPRTYLLIDDNDDCLDAAATIEYHTIKFSNFEELNQILLKLKIM